MSQNPAVERVMGLPGDGLPGDFFGVTSPDGAAMARVLIWDNHKGETTVQERGVWHGQAPLQVTVVGSRLAVADATGQQLFAETTGAELQLDTPVTGPDRLHQLALIMGDRMMSRVAA